MNKKQVAIIVTLLVLIVCAGVLATQLNSPLAVNDDGILTDKSTVSLNKDTENATTTNNFTEAKLTRDSQDNITMETLKQIKDDKDMATDSRTNATTEYQKLTLEKSNIISVETQIKALGFQDALCFINSDKVKILVKTEEKLNDKVTKEISTIVMDVLKTRDLSIDVAK